MEYCGAGSVADLMRILQSEMTESQIAVVAKETLKVPLHVDTLCL